VTYCAYPARYCRLWYRLILELILSLLLYSSSYPSWCLMAVSFLHTKLFLMNLILLSIPPPHNPSSLVGYSDSSEQGAVGEGLAALLPYDQGRIHHSLRDAQTVQVRRSTAIRLYTRSCESVDNSDVLNFSLFYHCFCRMYTSFRPSSSKSRLLKL
jgi:hypothetical protein